MKIIKQVDTATWSYRTTCEGCDSELQVESSDVKYKHWDGDQRDPSYDEYYTHCPVCSAKIDIPEDKVPKALKVKAKTKSSYGGPSDR